eukprot:CAMPEP_0177631196 /NCGR_PEP_ID=MMETSP0447-20121125/1617_1 /TAXON_ID=0 /ORGANISM="Stygamoeba regulata, Strain BSH-02190019" /LENGTH=765 /DNA_ID=CAMNT_0019132657 /DNA_START=244 /DNA_END=2541 /DNA_ORIENTATION=-
MEKYGGLYAKLWFQLNIYIMVYMAICTVLALAVLLPLNVINCGNGAAGTGFGCLMYGGQNTEIGWVHAGFVWVFSFMLYFAVLMYQRKFIEMRRGHRNRKGAPETHTVKIKNIPKPMQNEQILMDYMETLYPDQILAVHLVWDGRDMLEQVNKSNDAANNIQRCETRLKQNRPPIGRAGIFGPIGLKFAYPVCCCIQTQTDLLEYWKQKERDANDRLAQLRRMEPKPSTGIGFVTFKHGAAALKCRIDFHTKKTMTAFFKQHPVSEPLNSLHWKIKQAPPYGDIIWRNVHVSKTSRNIRVTILTALVFILAVLIAIPVAWLGRATEDLGLNLDPQYENLVSSYLPTLATVVIQGILPLTLEFICGLERPFSKSSWLASVMRKYYVYLVWNVLIWQTVFQGNLQDVFSLFQNSGSIQKTFTENNSVLLRIKGAFFVAYILQLTFIGAGVTMLIRLADFCERYARRWFLAISEEDYTNANVVTRHRYYLYLPEIAVVTTITLVYSVFVPIIFPVALAWLVVRHWIDKNNIVNVTPKDPGDARMLPQILYFFCIGLLMFQGFMIAMFHFKGPFGSQFFICPLVVFTLALLGWVVAIFYYEDFKSVVLDMNMLEEVERPYFTKEVVSNTRRMELLKIVYKHRGLLTEEEQKALSIFLDPNYEEALHNEEDTARPPKIVYGRNDDDARPPRYTDEDDDGDGRPPLAGGGGGPARRVMDEDDDGDGRPPPASYGGGRYEDDDGDGRPPPASYGGYEDEDGGGSARLIRTLL